MGVHESGVNVLAEFLDFAGLLFQGRHLWTVEGKFISLCKKGVDGFYSANFTITFFQLRGLRSSLAPSLFVFSPVLLLPGNVIICFFNPLIAPLDESRKILETRQMVWDFLTFIKEAMKDLQLGFWFVRQVLVEFAFPLFWDPGTFFNLLC